jgi:hypothetical protein
LSFFFIKSIFENKNFIKNYFIYSGKQTLEVATEHIGIHLLWMLNTNQRDHHNQGEENGISEAHCSNLVKPEKGN